MLGWKGEKVVSNIKFAKPVRPMTRVDTVSLSLCE